MRHAGSAQNWESGRRVCSGYAIYAVRRRAAQSKKGISFITTLFSTQRFNKILSDSETILFPKPLEPRRQFNMRSTLGPNPLRSTKSRARATSKSGVDKKFLILFALALGEFGRHFAHSHT